MLNNYMGLLYLSDMTENIRALTKVRPLAAVPVGGSYRIVDFALSNMVNAGIKNVAIFTPNIDMSSLHDHLGKGAEWDLDRKRDGIFIFEGMVDTKRSRSPELIKKNIDYFLRSTQENVVLMSPYMICNIDMEDVIASHEASGKDITIVYKSVNASDMQFDYCDSVTIKTNKNGTKEVTNIGQNILPHGKTEISLEIFVMNKEILIKMICDGVKDGWYLPAKDLVAEYWHNYTLNPYEFKGYLACIKSTKSYFDFNMDLLDKDIRAELFDQEYRHVYTKVKDTPPTIYGKGATVTNSLISNGCTLKGTVRNSILSRGTVIEEGAVVENCIIFQNCTIHKGAHLKNIIVDKNNEIRSNEKLQTSPNYPLVIEKTININNLKLKDYLRDLNDVQN